MSAVEFLLDNGADVNIKNNENFTLLMYCSKHGDIELLKTVLYHGASVNDIDLSGFTALDYSIFRDDIRSVKFLVENGAKINDSSYILAVKNNLKEIVDYFDSYDPNKDIFLKERMVTYE